MAQVIIEIPPQSEAEVLAALKGVARAPVPLQGDDLDNYADITWSDVEALVVKWLNEAVKRHQYEAAQATARNEVREMSDLIPDPRVTP